MPTRKTSPEPILWTTRDVQRRCQVGKHAALRLIHLAGPVRLGASLRVRPEDIARVLAEQRLQGRTHA